MKNELLADIETAKDCSPHFPVEHGMTEQWVVDGDDILRGILAQAGVALTNQGNFAGLLLVQSDDASRVWAANELLLLHTVADQLTVAVNQARLFAQMQEQALTDGLTGCYNRRSFESQLEQDLQAASRLQFPLSLIMLDLDNFKYINDEAGHEIGDLALRAVADSLRAELGRGDSASRFGGDEFAVILSDAGKEVALAVQQVRRRVLRPKCRVWFRELLVWAATFPVHASSRDSLVVTESRALLFKHSGRNCGCLPPEEGYDRSASLSDMEGFPRHVASCRSHLKKGPAQGSKIPPTEVGGWFRSGLLKNSGQAHLN